MLLRSSHTTFFWAFLSWSFICYGAYEWGKAQQYPLFIQLKEEKKRLESELAQAHEEQEKLRLQIASQSDPAWIELTLMRVLGRTPEGDIKVYFVDR